MKSVLVSNTRFMLSYFSHNHLQWWSLSCCHELKNSSMEISSFVGIFQDHRYFTFVNCLNLNESNERHTTVCSKSRNVTGQTVTVRVKYAFVIALFEVVACSGISIFLNHLWKRKLMPKIEGFNCKPVFICLLLYCLANQKSVSASKGNIVQGPGLQSSLWVLSMQTQWVHMIVLRIAEIRGKTLGK